MKKLLFSVSALLIVVMTHAVYATEKASPLNSEAVTQLLDQELQQYIDQVTTLRGKELIAAADIISGAGRTDPALYDAVESKLTELKELHYADKKNKLLSREVNSLMRTLGSISPKSSTIISELLEGSHSRGIRNRAVRLLPKLSWYDSRNEIMMKSVDFDNGDNLMAYRFYNLVDSELATMVRWASEEIARRKGTEQFVYDRMYDVINKHYKTQNPVMLDAVAWNCKIVKLYDTQQATQILNPIIAGGGYHKKINKYCNPAK